MDYVLEPGLDYFYFLKVFTLKMIYNNPATTKPTNSPISPVPARAIGPTYQIWDMEGMITAKDPKNANMAGADGGTVINGSFIQQIVSHALLPSFS